MNDEKHLENVVKNTFEVLKKVYKTQKENTPQENNDGNESRIIFPKKRDETTRISEQELRFVFVEQLNNEIKGDSLCGEKWDVYYSVETPTGEKYGFTSRSKESGNIDLVIHDAAKFRRIALIEFKANNRDAKGYQKDFEKLTNEKEGEIRWFIQIVEDSGSGTKANISEKLADRRKWGANRARVSCFSLNKGCLIIDEIVEKTDRK